MIVTEWPELRDVAQRPRFASDAHPVLIDGATCSTRAAQRPASSTRASAPRPRRLPSLSYGRRSPALMEAIVLAGGKAERLGDAAQGRPKSLVRSAAPARGVQVARLVPPASTRVIVAAAPGQEELRERARRPRRRDRPGRRARAARPRRRIRVSPRRAAASDGHVFALNGDELVDVDFHGAARPARARSAAATIVVAQPPSQFGVVDLDDDDLVTGFHEAPLLATGSTAASTCSARRRSRASRRRATTRRRPSRSSPPRARCARFRHSGVWLTVNTPKDLRVAESYVAEHPGVAPRRRAA